MSEQKGLTCGERILLVFRRKQQENFQPGGIGQVSATEDELRAEFGECSDNVTFETFISRLCKHHMEEPQRGVFRLTSEGRQALVALEIRLQKATEQSNDVSCVEVRHTPGLSLATA